MLKAISGAEDILTLKLYYDIDTVGNGEEGDGTPDKYQKKVIFKVINGTWADGTTADKFVYLDLMKDGEYAVDGTAALTAPTGMLANEGFGNGSWDMTPPATVNGAEDETYTYSFEEKKNLTLTVIHVNKTDSAVFETETISGLTFGDAFPAADLAKVFAGYKYDSASADSVTITEGVNEITIYYVKNSYSYTVNYLEEGTGKALRAAKTAAAEFEAIVNSADEIIAISDYIFVGADKNSITIGTDAGSNVINLYYTPDTIGGGSNGGNSDGIPDKYQKKVIFKVVNGTWADATIADKIVYLTLLKDGQPDANGAAMLTAPTGMLPMQGCTGGAWDLVPPATVSGTATETYTFRFTENYIIEIPDQVTVYEDETIDITVVIIPNEGTDEENIPKVEKYESDDESIAIVDQNGKVTGVKKGTTTVTVTFTDGTTKKVTVVVKERQAIHVVFGKTDGIGWYNVSMDGGKTYQIVFGNSTLEVKQGTQLMINVGDLTGDAFVFYVNGDKVYPDDNGNLVITVNNYMLIGALGYAFEVPDVEESLNWFQKIMKAIKDFFEMLFGWMK